MDKFLENMLVPPGTALIIFCLFRSTSLFASSCPSKPQTFVFLIPCPCPLLVSNHFLPFITILKSVDAVAHMEKEGHVFH